MLSRILALVAEAFKQILARVCVVPGGPRNFPSHFTHEKYKKEKNQQPKSTFLNHASGY